MNNDLTLWEEKDSTEQMKKNENNEEIVKTDSISDTKTDSTKNDLNDTTKKSGIYKIVNKINGKYYVGSTKNFKNRWREHKRKLEGNNHPNEKLQNAYNKYGVTNFNYVVVEEAEITELLIVGQRYLDYCKETPHLNYNLSYIAGRPELTEFIKSKISTSLTGNKNPNFGKPREESTKRKISEANLGKEVSAETKLKQSVSRNKWSFSKEHLESFRINMTDERRLYLRELAKKRLTPEYLTDHAIKCKTESHRSKISHGKKSKQIYSFKNLHTNEVFVGTKFDWYMKFFGKCPSNIDGFMKGKRTSLKGWRLMR